MCSRFVCETVENENVGDIGKVETFCKIDLFGSEMQSSRVLDS